MNSARPTRYEIAAWLFAAAALVFVLLRHLLPALLAGLLVYQLTHILAAHLPGKGALSGRRKMIAVALLVSLVVLLVSGAILGAMAFFRSDSGSLTALLGKMAEIIEGSRDKLPLWLADKLPDNAGDIKEAIGHWLRGHGEELQTLGKEAGHGAAHLLIGIVIGALVALREVCNRADTAPPGRRPDGAGTPLQRRLPPHRVRPGENLGGEYHPDRPLPGGGPAPARHPPAP